MSILGTLRSIISYIIVVFLSLMAGFAIASIASVTKESFEEPVCPSTPTKKSTVSQQIVIVFRRELGRVPSINELQHYLDHFRDQESFSDVKLTARLHETPEFKHAIKMQTNLVNAEIEYRMNDRQIDLYIHDIYTKIYHQRIPPEKLGWLRLKYAHMNFDCGRFEAFLKKLHAAENAHDAVADTQSCLAIRDHQPVDDMIETRKEQDREPRSKARFDKNSGSCPITAAPEKSALAGTFLEEVNDLILPVGRYVFDECQAPPSCKA